MYILSKIKQVEEAKAVISLLLPGSKYYWISQLDVCDAIKGYLLIYFNV